MLSAAHIPSASFGEVSTTLTAALQSLARGWSVIPLVGGEDAQTGKRPLKPWQPYQERLPAKAEVQRWFRSPELTAYGIVCGRISRLVVIDLDTKEAEEEFARLFPHLLDTFTVRSGFRKTPHLYYHVDFPVQTAKLKGGDLKGEGSYVVGPRSVIAGQTWEVVRDLPPKHLLPSDVEHILQFFLPYQTIEETPRPALEKRERNFGQLYQRQVGRTGERNESLFLTARRMRDTGHSQTETVDTLAQLHALQPPILPQRQESYERRYREAIKTIDSVYSRPPRNITDSCEEGEEGSRLNNLLRERLLQQSDGAAFLRTYEALLLKGIQPHQEITRPQIFALLKGTVGEHSIKRALKTFSRERKPLFPPFPGPLPPAHADTDPVVKRATKCFVDGQKPPESRPAHRPAKQYRMLSEEELCKAFDVEAENVPRDTIILEDIKSAKRYRQRLECKLIQRKPGQYPMGWLADRLGVSRRTIYAYHRESDIETLACYFSEEITWFNLHHKLPDKQLAQRGGIDLRGWSLEDEKGKRYPIQAGLAQKLLAKGRKLSLKRRTFNFYRIQPDLSSLAEMTKIPIPHNSIEKRSSTPVQPTVSVPEPMFVMPTKEKEILLPPPQSPELLSLLSQPAPARFTKKFIPSPESEALAEAVWKETGRYDKNQRMSLVNARRLIQTYGMESVRNALKRLCYLQARGKIENASGFLIDGARVSWRSRHSREKAPVYQRRSRRKGSAPQNHLLDTIITTLIYLTEEDYLRWRADFEMENGGDWLKAARWFNKIETDLPW